MKAKTIKAILAKKFADWLQSLPESLRELVKGNTIITGGSIVSLLLNEKVSDYDIYFRDKKTALAIAEHYVKLFVDYRKKNDGVDTPIFVQDCIEEVGGDTRERVKIVVKSSGIASEDDSKMTYRYFETVPDNEGAEEYVREAMRLASDVDTEQETKDAVDPDEKPPYRPVFLSTNAITLSGKVQLVLRFYGEPEDIHKNYDFVHCTNYWTSWDGELVLHPKALESILAKELVYVGSKYPVCSIFRIRKFITRGWTINAGQMLKMLMQVNTLDLTDIKVLEDQLTGVDVAYFLQVVEYLKEKMPEGQTKIDTAYLIEIIERMF